MSTTLQGVARGMAKDTQTIDAGDTRGPSPAADALRPGNDLLGLQDLSAAAIRGLLESARRYAPIANRPETDTRELAGRTIATLFFEDSTRTKTSFTLAALRLGAEVVDLAVVTSSVNKGETLVDTALNVEAMGVSGLVVRARQSGSAAMIAQAARCPVINGGDGTHEHPTQGLLDAYTIAEAFGRLEGFDLSGLVVAIVGDLASSRVARSNIACLTALGARVVCVGPPNLAPALMATLGRGGEGTCRVGHDVDAVLPEADAVMMLRVQFERHGGEGDAAKPAAGPAAPSPAIGSVAEYRERYAMTRARAARLKPGAIVMHPGPMNRGLEIESEVADGPRSVILTQVARGVAVRMACLAACVGGR